MNHSTSQSLQRHIVDVLLDASDADHPINIVLHDYPNLLEFYGSTYDYSYIDDLRWTDPQTGELNELCDEHMEELYAMHCLAHDLYDNHERDIGDILLARLNREAFLLYLEPDDFIDRAIEPQDQKPTAQQSPPKIPRNSCEAGTAQPPPNLPDLVLVTDLPTGETPPQQPNGDAHPSMIGNSRGPVVDTPQAIIYRLEADMIPTILPPPEPPPEPPPREESDTLRTQITQPDKLLMGETPNELRNQGIDGGKDERSLPLPVVRGERHEECPAAREEKLSHGEHAHTIQFPSDELEEHEEHSSTSRIPFDEVKEHERAFDETKQHVSSLLKLDKGMQTIEEGLIICSDSNSNFEFSISSKGCRTDCNWRMKRGTNPQHQHEQQWHRWGDNLANAWGAQLSERSITCTEHFGEWSVEAMHNPSRHRAACNNSLWGANVDNEKRTKKRWTSQWSDKNEGERTNNSMEQQRMTTQIEIEPKPTASTTYGEMATHPDLSVICETIHTNMHAVRASMCKQWICEFQIDLQDNRTAPNTTSRFKNLDLDLEISNLLDSLRVDTTNEQHSSNVTSSSKHRGVTDDSTSCNCTARRAILFGILLQLQPHCNTYCNTVGQPAYYEPT